MKRIIFAFCFSTFALFSFGQEEEENPIVQEGINVEICVKHRTDELSNVCFESKGSTTDFDYLKLGIINCARQYSIKVPNDCMLAKLRFISLKNGVEIERREQSFSKSAKAKYFDFDENARMGPYMKPHGEDQVRIEMIVYRKNTGEPGYHRVDREQTTFTINLNQERDLLAENE